MFVERNTLARTLHTLFIKVEAEKKLSFQRLKCIRILKLKGDSIEKLDDSIGGLVHLRYLNLSSTEIRVLPESIVEASLFSHLENVCSKEEASKADLSSKKNLYNIHFKWSEDEQGANRIDKDVLEGLQPPRDVKTLTIKNFSGDNFPNWVIKMVIHVEGKWTLLDKLMDIILSDYRSCLSLPTLEHLPHLRHLWLQNMDRLTCLSTFDGTGLTKPLPPSLTSLLLYRMRRLEKWIDGAPNSSKMI
ncbi:unnamed protein product [Lactuca virosa]|uniref:R13L1/DRL21-like LRR repeat region domain-containing protein n=1 Tax=Lactuca virosa TaxID=75947 RepID=A0AAU9NBK6_9ASTR|nr:unnamed protein product [Lactuca virosa]